MSDGDRTENPIELSIGSAPLEAEPIAPIPVPITAPEATAPSASGEPAPKPPQSSPANKPKNYTDQLKDDFMAIFESLSLTKPANKAFLRARWLDQILWMEAKSAQCRDRHFRLRLITIIGGVIVPILVTLNLNDQRIENAVKQATIGISGAVAITAAIEEFFQYGKRWYNYRRGAESLKAQGWHFFQLSGPYRNFADHNEAFQAFAENIEEIIQRDVETYVTQNQQDRQEQRQQSANYSNNSDQNVI